MTTLAGSKIRKFREERTLSRAAFGAWFGTPGSTIQGWEDEGKRASAAVVNQIAAHGIAHHQDWYVQVSDQDLAAASCPASWQRPEFQAQQLPDYPDQVALDAVTA